VQQSPYGETSKFSVFVFFCTNISDPIVHITLHYILLGTVQFSAHQLA